MSESIVLFPIDLYDDMTYIKDKKVFLVEEEIYFNRSSKKLGNLTFNIMKPIYHRATMMCYYDKLKSNKIDCTYIDYVDDWVDIVKKYVKKSKKQLYFFDPVDRTLEIKLKKNFDNYDIIDTPRFILSNDEMDLYDGVIRQTSFYIWIRKYKNILMENDKPVGGKISYDNENRKSPYKGIDDDLEIEKNYNDNEYIIEAFKYIKKNFDGKDFYIFDYNDDMKNIKNLNDTKLKFKFPIDTKGARKRLKNFIINHMNHYGDYQDIILKSDDNSFIFHSGLSPMINIGLITPEEIINEILKYYNKSKNKKKLLHNVEGFIRQLLGWREFTRYMYKYHSDEYLNKNFFNSKIKLSSDWYNATMFDQPVINNCISKAFQYGYLHHIERLMVIANFMTISHIDPKEMYKWFMEFSLDSYDWVMEYNVYCMASYSDGGQYTSKPYISSSNYIHKMSDYSKKDNEWSEEWNDLFWKFIKKHSNKIKKIGRLSMLVKYAKNK